MNKLLRIKDPVIYNIIKKEFLRQKRGLELIASENFTSKAVMSCVGSVLTNKYSEGQAGNRYYGGCKYIDQIENLCFKSDLKPQIICEPCPALFQGDKHILQSFLSSGNTSTSSNEHNSCSSNDPPTLLHDVIDSDLECPSIPSEEESYNDGDEPPTLLGKCY